MSENPFEPPASDFEAKEPGYQGAQQMDLKNIAYYQKRILVCILVYLSGLYSRLFIWSVFSSIYLVCILVYLLCLAGQFAVPRDFVIVVGIGILAILSSLVSTVFVFLLSMKLYNVAIGILLGILALVPVFGLFVLLIVNSKATSILKANGIKVGLLGANLSQI